MNTRQDNNLYTSFIGDGEHYVQNLNSLFLELEKNPGSSELIRQAFRNAHSLKSEASYLNESEIAEVAHEMESALDVESGTLDRSSFDFLFYSLDRIHEMINLRKTQKHGTITADDSIASTTANSAHQSSAQQTGSHEDSPSLSDEKKESPFEYPEDEVRFIPEFNDFERELLREARERGERFLRVSVQLDETTAITYAKGYLILNNLEQLLQVVKSNPPFGAGHERQSNEGEYRNITFYCTGDVEDREIYKVVNVDQVERILISPLTYESVVEEQVGEPEWEHSMSNVSIRIDGASIDQLNGYVDELKIRIHRLRRMFTEDGEQIEVLTKIVDGLESFTRQLSMVELNEVFQSHYRMVRDLAAKLGKKAELSLEGCDIRVDRRAAEVLSEIVVHMIRNALDHGIEPPEQRLREGKSEMGQVHIRAESEDNKLIVTVSDDGQGIRRQQLIEKAKQQGIRIDEVTGGEDELLRFLVYPGLTTLGDATETSGRGYGLDLVFQKIRQFEGGGLSVRSDEQGTSFTVELPSGFTLLTLQIVRCGSRLIAVPQQHIREIVTLDEGVFSADENGGLLWNAYPVYTLEGRLYQTDVSPTNASGLIIRYLGREAVVLVDELMFKKEIPEDRLTLYIEGSPYLHKMKISGAGTGFFYLSPSIVAM